MEWYVKRNDLDDISTVEFCTIIFKNYFANFFLFLSILPTEIGDTDLSRKISLCNELLQVAQVVEPGESIFRGKLLVDLQEALCVQTERQLSGRDISAVVAKVSFSGSN